MYMLQIAYSIVKRRSIYPTSPIHGHDRTRTIEAQVFQLTIKRTPQAVHLNACSIRNLRQSFVAAWFCVDQTRRTRWPPVKVNRSDFNVK